MKPVSSMHPVLYRLSVLLRRSGRHIRWRFSSSPFALEKSPVLLDFPIVNHRSLLLRRLEGADMELQRNKIESLKAACRLVDSVLVRPGEVFSFWKLVGRPSVRRGFPPGLQLSFGSLVSMEGGGLCQMTNLIHWMVLHTSLTVTERHRHSTDPFPDHRRAVPFGTGATVFYNYLDLAFSNGTPHTYQICLKTGPEYLEGEIRCDSIPPVSFSVEERNHRFVADGGKVFRMNELWRTKTEVSSDRVLEERLLMRNRCRVMYEVSQDLVETSGGKG